MEEQKQDRAITYYFAIKAQINPLQEEGYRAFHSRLMKTAYPFYGVRTPVLKKLETTVEEPELFLEGANRAGLSSYEEILLYAFVLSKQKEYDTFCKYLPKYLSALDNWATCDLGVCAFSIIKRNRERFLSQIKIYAKAENSYMRRFAFVALLAHYKKEEYLSAVFSFLAENKEERAEVSMAKAWLLQGFYVAFPAKTKEFLLQGTLNGVFIGKIDEATQKRAFQKLRDSYRVSAQDKKELFKG